jgi:Papain family cysteine protease
MAVHHEFFMYRGGVYRASQPNLRVEGYHSVRLIGWGEEPMPNGPPVKYWVRILLKGLFIRLNLRYAIAKPARSPLPPKMLKFDS